MARLKALTGDQVVAILGDFGYQVEKQKGQHVKLRRSIGRGLSRTITFPRVKDMDRLTLSAIFHEAAQYAQEARLRGRFYED